MITPFQFLMLSGSPEKEEKFLGYKKQHGTVFAFHGTELN
jgi:hypothetical protein